MPGCPVCVLPMGRIDAGLSLAIEHGAQVSDYKGKRLITHHEENDGGKVEDDMAFCDAEPSSEKLDTSPKFIEPHDVP